MTEKLVETISAVCFIILLLGVITGATISFMQPKESATSSSNIPQGTVNKCQAKDDYIFLPTGVFLNKQSIKAEEIRLLRLELQTLNSNVTELLSR